MIVVERIVNDLSALWRIGKTLCLCIQAMMSLMVSAGCIAVPVGHGEVSTRVSNRETVIIDKELMSKKMNAQLQSNGVAPKSFDVVVLGQYKANVYEEITESSSAPKKILVVGLWPYSGTGFWGNRHPSRRSTLSFAGLNPTRHSLGHFGDHVVDMGTAGFLTGGWLILPFGSAIGTPIFMFRETFFDTYEKKFRDGYDWGVYSFFYPIGWAKASSGRRDLGSETFRDNERTETVETGIPDITVSLRDPATGFQITRRTDSEGKCRFDPGSLPFLMDKDVSFILSAEGADQPIRPVRVQIPADIRGARLADNILNDLDGFEHSQIFMPDRVIDFSTGELEGAPWAQTVVTLLDQPEGRSDIVPLQVEVNNQGRGAIHRLVAHTSSATSDLDGHLMVFGKIESGQTATRTVELPVSRLTGLDPWDLDVQFHELNDYTPREVALRIEPHALRRPRLAAGYEVVDDPEKSDMVSGNADGVIQRGEAIDLVVRVKNTGRETARDASLSISLPESPCLTLFTDQELRLGDIEPGELKTERFNISIRPNSELSALDVQLRLAETSFGFEADKEINLPFDARVAPVPYGIDEEFYARRDGTELYAGASQDADKIGSVSRGMLLRGEARLRDEWVRVRLPEEAVEAAGMNTAWVRLQQLSTDRPAEAATGSVSIQRFGTAPSVMFATPSTGHSTRRDAVRVTATVSDGSALAEVIVRAGAEGNLKPIQTLTPGESEFVFDSEVPLVPGANVIEITGVNADGQPTTRSIEVMREAGLDTESFVLSVGVEDYHFMGKVPGCHADARDMAQALQALNNIDPANVLTVLTDSEDMRRNPTGGVLRNRIRQLADEVGSGGVAFFYFSGHGVMHDNDLMLIPQDGDETNGVMLDWVMAELDRSEARQRVVVLDTCRSAAEKGITGIAPDFSASRNTAVFFSASEGEMSYPGVDGEQSIYTGFFLEALADLSEQGETDITAQGLQGLIESKMRRWRTETGKRQTPVLIAPPGEPLPLIPTARR